MAHASTQSFQAPAHLTLAPPADGDDRDMPEFKLIVNGQGTIGFAIAEQAPFTFDIALDAAKGPAFKWEIGADGVRLLERSYGDWEEVLRKPGVGVDPEPNCPYWFSIDTLNRVLRYGKGETRLACVQAEHWLSDKPKAPEKDYYGWLGTVAAVQVSAATKGTVDIWRDPVTVDPPLIVVPHDAITMDQMAFNHCTVPANLSPTGQQLYDNVAGKGFVLNTLEFPDFTEAIKRSILSERGWCYKRKEPHKYLPQTP